MPLLDRKRVKYRVDFFELCLVEWFVSAFEVFLKRLHIQPGHGIAFIKQFFLMCSELFYGLDQFSVVVEKCLELFLSFLEYGFESDVLFENLKQFFERNDRDGELSFP